MLFFVIFIYSVAVPWNTSINDWLHSTCALFTLFIFTVW